MESLDVVVGESIGPLRLGMSIPEAEAALAELFPDAKGKLRILRDERDWTSVYGGHFLGFDAADRVAFIALLGPTRLRPRCSEVDIFEAPAWGLLEVVARQLDEPPQHDGREWWAFPTSGIGFFATWANRQRPGDSVRWEGCAVSTDLRRFLSLEPSTRRRAAALERARAVAAAGPNGEELVRQSELAAEAAFQSRARERIEAGPIWEVEPGRSVGPFQLGMSREDALALADSLSLGACLELLPGRGSFFSSGLQLECGLCSEVESIELSLGANDPDVVYQGVRLLSDPTGSVLSRLEVMLDEKPTRTANDVFVFARAGLALTPNHEGDPFYPPFFSSVIVGTPEVMEGDFYHARIETLRARKRRPNGGFGFGRF